MLGVLLPGEIAVDVGAYKGGYTYWMRCAVGAEGGVVAFEPQPPAAAMLRRYVSAFAWTNVTVEECALSSETGTRPLLAPGDGPTPAASLVGVSLRPGAGRYAVGVETLDRYLAAHPPHARVALLKVDVEGHELDVFRGAGATLERHRPGILCECEARHLRGITMEDVFGHLRDLRYSGWFFRGRELLELSRFDPGAHQVEGRRPYTNNFVFLPTQ
jgi:FkbM family methyltransferase